MLKGLVTQTTDSKLASYNLLVIWNLDLESEMFAKKSWDSESFTEICLVSDPLVLTSS